MRAIKALDDDYDNCDGDDDETRKLIYRSGAALRAQFEPKDDVNHLRTGGL